MSKRIKNKKSFLHRHSGAVMWIIILISVSLIFVGISNQKDKSPQIPQVVTSQGIIPLEVPLYITAKTTDSIFHKDLANVSITVLNTNTKDVLFTTTTDKNGLAKFSQPLTNGHTYDFMIQKDGYYSFVIPIALSYDIKPTINSEVHTLIGNAKSEVNLNYTITSLNYTLDNNFRLEKICNPEIRRDGSMISVICFDGELIEPFIYLGDGKYKKWSPDMRPVDKTELKYIFNTVGAIDVVKNMPETSDNNTFVCLDDYYPYGENRIFDIANDVGLKTTCKKLSEI